jgi:hypothetical protein
MQLETNDIRTKAKKEHLMCSFLLPNLNLTKTTAVYEIREPPRLFYESKIGSEFMVEQEKGFESIYFQ